MLLVRSAAIASCLCLFGCEPPPPVDDGTAADDDDAPADDDDAPADDDDAPTDDDDEPADGDAEEALVATHNLGSVITDEGQASATVAAESVFMASQTAGTGQAVTTGTLTQTRQTFSYDPAPADRLVVAFADGTTFELFIETMQGDSTSATAFLNGDHAFTYRVVVGDKIDMTFSSTRQGGSLRAGADGRYAYEGVDYDIDLALVGTYAFESDSTGSYFLDEHRTTGEVTADGFDLDVDEGWRFELVTSSDGSAQAAQRTIANSLRSGGVTYDWLDVETKKNFRDGKPSELDTFWDARGQILRDGEPFGTYGLDSDVSERFVHFIVALPDATIELESHATY